MVVQRKLPVFGPKFHIGDQKTFENGMTATCQYVTENGIATFLMDQCLPEKQPMYQTRINTGTYEDSDLRKFLKEYFDNEPMFKGEIRDYMVPFEGGDYLRIPYAEELFGFDPHGFLEKSTYYSKKWSSMTNPKNRICHQFKNTENITIYWLANPCKVVPFNFAVVTHSGTIDISDCTRFRICNPCEVILHGVRIVFKLKNYL